MDPSKILVTVPTRGTPAAETVMALQAIRDAAPGLPPIHYLSTRLSVCDGRNRIVRRFLESSADFLVMCDDDIIPHAGLLRLAEHGLDIVAAPVLIVREEHSVPIPNVFEYDQKIEKFWPLRDTFKHTESGALIECTGVGTGVIGLSRRVLEHADLVAPFRHRWDAHGQMVMTEDLTFCIRALAAGFRIYADYHLLSDQIVRTNITGLAQRYGRAVENLAAPSRLVALP